MNLLSQPPDSWDASGVFETCRVRNGKILHQKEHLERLRFSMKTAGLVSSSKKMESLFIRAAKETKEGYVRLAVRRYGPKREIIHKQPGIPYSKEILRAGVSVKTVAARWPGRDTMGAQSKSSERLSHILAKMESGDSFEVLRIGAHGYLTEGLVSNFFLVKERVLKTSPSWLGVLAGVTRSRVLEAARRQKIAVQEIPTTRHDLFNADEAFLTNVLMEICPIREVDGRSIGLAVPGPVTKLLAERLKK